MGHTTHLSLVAVCPIVQFNPSKRLTAAEALAHPYVAQFHNPDDEPSCSRTITIPINDNHKYSIQVRLAPADKVDCPAWGACSPSWQLKFPGRLCHPTPCSLGGLKSARQGSATQRPCQQLVQALWKSSMLLCLRIWKKICGRADRLLQTDCYCGRRSIETSCMLRS
jgi:serine/threonine protein kinase